MHGATIKICTVYYMPYCLAVKISVLLGSILNLIPCSGCCLRGSNTENYRSDPIIYLPIVFSLLRSTTSGNLSFIRSLPSCILAFLPHISISSHVLRSNRLNGIISNTVFMFFILTFLSLNIAFFDVRKENFHTSEFFAGYLTRLHGTLELQSYLL